MNWRYWITYEGIVTAGNEDEAQTEAQLAVADYYAGFGSLTPTIEVEEVGEGE